MLNLDTHILIYALQGELTSKEKKILSAHHWGISGIVLWELHKLFELGRINLDIEDSEVFGVLSKLTVWPIDLHVARALKQLDFKGDPADEIIAATSVHHRVPLITRDRRILGSQVVPFGV
jgi:PIN domain nuclease of toxin-antitoxin system